MLKFYYSLAPNPMKVALFLGECGLPYEAIPVDTRKGEQHAPAFTALNPNAKVPVITDGDTTVFDSNAILLYLAEKTGHLLPEGRERGAMLSWLMFVASGVGPFTGQCVHFRHTRASQTHMLSTAMTSRLGVPGRSWMRIWRTGRGWWEAATRCSTLPCGAGREPCRLRWDPRPGPNCPTSSASLTRSANAPQRSVPQR